MKSIFTYIFQDKEESEYVKAKDPETTNLKWAPYSKEG